MPADPPAFQGGSSKLFRCRDPEVLLEGPAGTGKSFAVAWYIRWFINRYPGCRVLVCRKTRVSLSQSFLVTWEKVLGFNHQALTGVTRTNRQLYRFANGSELVLGGMDNPTRLFSTEYDLIFVNEATELAEGEWESLHRALRHYVAPYQQLLGDCNPDAPGHWLNLRCEKPYSIPPELRGATPEPRDGQTLTTRLLTRFDDNPTIKPEYLLRLSNLTGSRRDRLYLGKWTAAEGLIYPEWQNSRHLVSMDIEPGDRDGHRRDEKGRLELDWYFASQDWGYENPGVLQVWGVDRDSRLYRVAEVYRKKKNIDWWAARAVELHEEFDLRWIVCDHDPDAISIYNDRISDRCGGPMDRVARKCIKAKPKFTGWNEVRAAMAPEDGRSMIHFVRDAMRHGPDPLLVEAREPTSSEQEIESYTFLDVDSNRPIESREREDPTCANHGMDAMLYAWMWAWKRGVGKAKEPRRYTEGSVGDVLGFADLPVVPRA